MKREDKFSVRLYVDGVGDLGPWDRKSGGEVDSEETTYRLGGSPDRISLGGPVGTGNLTLARLYDENAHAVYHRLAAVAGRANATVVMQPLDENDYAFGRPIVWRCKLKRVSAPDYDSNGNAASLIEVELTVNGRPS